ncbi:probable xyloglucan endotransglucosylase/hydrolase protein 33 isoform X2 [Andrographis paniculata]|uniref:probable xyloglucan endotransglucosylase/hydrolase protein 33 isoform X2 n=1 Tax=Andrographis paniculata TaxID=175694 RepID=UPI0021E7FFDB|nr:probable xyloglucan endotransglucosylase/hydrolase protein 33 isoform X2 [Andrographis paniculata]
MENIFKIKKASIVGLLLILCSLEEVHSRGPIYTPPEVERLTDHFSRIQTNQGYTVSFGAPNVRLTNNGSGADLSLDKTSGSGLVSKNKYYYGFFNAAIKLPAGFTSGVVVAYYLSNADVFPHNHDEIDIELLGHEKRRDWVLQTNIYGNGSVRTGREEKFYLWFDPTQSFHDYSILWNNHHIVFLVDNIPIRQVIHSAAIAAVYPSKAMSVHATIWDGSEWATHGGKYPVDYKFAPFTISMKGIEMEGCVMNNNKSISKDSVCSRNSLSSLDPVDGEQFAKLSSQQMAGLGWARGKHMFYSYCQDKSRYKVLPPECSNAV